MNLADKIADLDRLSTAELAAEYERLHDRRPRYRSPAWMRKRIAYQLQVAAYGGLPGPARAELERIAADLQLPGATRRDADAPTTGQLRPGTVLQRDWHHQHIRVEVTRDGFVWNGETYRSLSAIAFAITGAKWNGRLFFGLIGRSRS